MTGVATMIMVIEIEAMGIVSPIAKFDLNISTAEQGLLNSISTIGVILSSHFWGYLTDTWGRLKAMKLALLTLMVSSIISAFSVTNLMLIICRLGVGLRYCFFFFFVIYQIIIKYGYLIVLVE